MRALTAPGRIPMSNLILTGQILHYKPKCGAGVAIAPSVIRQTYNGSRRGAEVAEHNEQPSAFFAPLREIIDSRKKLAELSIVSPKLRKLRTVQYGGAVSEPTSRPRPFFLATTVAATR